MSGRYYTKGNKMLKIGYQGVHGAFSEVALINYFKEQEYETVSYQEFTDMFQAVDDGEIDYGMFPVENTTTGIIARTYDYFQFYDVHAVGEIVVPIRECLIAIPGTKKEEIEEVYSHPEALSQCYEFFLANRNMKEMVYEDTALSVQYVKELGDKSKAALASARAAEYYDMEILEANVQDNSNNMTRFLVVTKDRIIPDDANKVSIRFVTKHRAGALYHALGIFAALNINMTKLESRPIVGKIFDYCFYLDFEGSLNDPNVREALRRLEYDCEEVQVFGCYKGDPDVL